MHTQVEEIHQIKYSVIIPAYNAEKTIKRCLESLFTDRHDVEIIVVDDGSRDNTAEILDAYSQQYSYIKALHKTNAGVSTARNTGIDHATGEYILFVDSDDYVSNGYFNELDYLDNADLCVFPRKNIGSEISDEDFFERFTGKENFMEMLEQLIVGRRMLPPWNKRYKRSIIENHNIRFCKEFVIGEDFDFCMNYVLHCSSITTSKKALYYLDITDMNSLSRGYRKDLSKKLLDVYRHIERMICHCDNPEISIDTVSTAVDYLYARNVIGCVAEEFKVDHKNYLQNKQLYASICKDFRKEYKNRQGYVNGMHRVIRIMLRMNMVLSLYVITYIVKGR